MPQHLQHRVGVLRVQVAGGLVRKNDSGARDQRTGNGDALLLAAGQFAGPAVQPRLDTQQLCQVLQQGVV